MKLKKKKKDYWFFYLASHGFDTWHQKGSFFDYNGLVFNPTLDKINKKRKVFYFLGGDHVLSVEVPTLRKVGLRQVVPC